MNESAQEMRTSMEESERKERQRRKIKEVVKTVETESGGRKVKKKVKRKDGR